MNIYTYIHIVYMSSVFYLFFTFYFFSVEASIRSYKTTFNTVSWLKHGSAVGLQGALRGCRGAGRGQRGVRGVGGEEQEEEEE